MNQMSSQTTIDNNSLLKGGNTSKEVTVEVPIEAVGRTLLQGAFLTQKSGDGTLFQEHSLHLASDIVGITGNDIDVPIDVGVGELGGLRVHKGPVDEAILLSNNGIANLDIIPAGATLSYRLQLEKIGIEAQLSNQMSS